jgi:hypothetical protein
MRVARKHKELPLGALQRIEHHTHRAGNSRLQDAYCPLLCWRKCLGAERDFVVNATIPVPCARSSRAGRHEVNGGHLPARVGKPTRPANVRPPPFPALQPDGASSILPEQRPLADVAA